MSAKTGISYVHSFTYILLTIQYLATRDISSMSNIIHTYTSQCMYMYRMQCSWYITEVLDMHIIINLCMQVC